MAKTKKILLTNTGREYEITGDNGRFWVCGHTQFRKGSTMIADIKTVKEPDKAAKKAKKDEVKGE